MIDWKRYEDELAAARSARIAADVVVAARRSRRNQLVVAAGLVGAAVLLLVHLGRAPARRRVYQMAATVRAPSSTTPRSVHRS